MKKLLIVSVLLLSGCHSYLYVPNDKVKLLLSDKIYTIKSISIGGMLKLEDENGIIVIVNEKSVDNNYYK